MSVNMQVCTFRVSQFYCGIAISAVQEVIRSLEVTRAPLAPDGVSGLVTVRGDVLTAIDLRKKLCLGTPSTSSEIVNVVVQSQGESISLWADDVEDVIEVDGDAGELPPDTLNPDVRELIIRVYEVGERLLLLLDPERITAVAVKD